MQFVSSVTLLSPGSSDSEFAFSTLWDAEKEFAAKVRYHKLGRVFSSCERYLLGAKADAGWVGEDGVDVLALWALNIHEE
tara:strand:- start:108 stop:347 length:240 start_codon:yes stop_codon:yes gene_type:complete